jgi:hypothetical protein
VFNPDFVMAAPPVRGPVKVSVVPEGPFTVSAVVVTIGFGIIKFPAPIVSRVDPFPIVTEPVPRAFDAPTPKVKPVPTEIFPEKLELEFVKPKLPEPDVPLMARAPDPVKLLLTIRS